VKGFDVVHGLHASLCRGRVRTRATSVRTHDDPFRRRWATVVCRIAHLTFANPRPQPISSSRKRKPGGHASSSISTGRQRLVLTKVVFPEGVRRPGHPLRLTVQNLRACQRTISVFGHLGGLGPTGHALQRLPAGTSPTNARSARAAPTRHTSPAFRDIAHGAARARRMSRCHADLTTHFLQFGRRDRQLWRVRGPRGRTVHHRLVSRERLFVIGAHRLSDSSSLVGCASLDALVFGETTNHVWGPFLYLRRERASADRCASSSVKPGPWGNPCLRSARDVRPNLSATQQNPRPRSSARVPTSARSAGD